MRILTTLIFYCTFWVQGLAQDRYAVYFNDKTGSPYSISNPLEFLSQKSLDRRERYGIQINESDLPVNPGYLESLRITGAEVFYGSRWLNLALIQATADQLTEISQLSFVKSIEYIAPGAPLTFSGRMDKIERTEENSTDLTLFQKEMIGLDYQENLGLDGTGLLIANMDIGFRGLNTNSAFQHIYPDKIIDSFNYVNNSEEVFISGDHGTRTLSLLAAQEEADYKGILPNADYVLYVTEDGPTEYRVEEYYWLFAAERADSIGVDIISSSLGYFDFDDPSMNYSISDLDGNTAVITKAANYAVSAGMMVVLSAGNQGNSDWTRITFPKDCFGCMVVGSVGSLETRSSFSSIGPTADGRIKPDVMALGQNVVMIGENGSPVTSSGTSFAAPQITGLLGGLLSLFPLKKHEEIYSAVKETASMGNSPDIFMGWGIPHFDRARRRLAFDPTSSQSVNVAPTFITNRQVTVSVSDPESIPTLKVQFFSMSGQLLLSRQLDFSWQNSDIEININSLSQGLYLLRYSDESTTYGTLRIIVQ